MAKKDEKLAGAIRKLSSLIDVQRASVERNGYAAGMYNGMVLALSIMDDSGPSFVSCPEESSRRFINHIQAHLEADEAVVCKICGMSADEIIGT